jgi:tetratricopeptide (TPR) repeat protein
MAAGLALAALAAVGAYFLAPRQPPARPPEAAAFVGSESCRQCHASEFAAWRGSHHGLAMQEANAKTVFGDFNDAAFEHHGVRSTFFRRDGKYLVRTDGPDGKLADFEVKYTFGVTPLQQYLIAFPGGRLQALSIAWDSRKKEDGGQRWFHLYPKETIDHTDPLHWTGLYQTWNLQCAHCHSTDLAKNYDPATSGYQTTWSEVSVGCEACHGPGSRHVAWAEEARPPYGEDDRKGLATFLSSRREAWHLPAEDAQTAVREGPSASEAMNVCWPCHSRRSVLKEKAAVDAPLFDAYRPSFLVPPLYHPDGQQREEVYTWGSFTQSRMFHRGVTCMDCHEPHGLKLVAEGNALCGRCHNPAVFDVEEHHRHEPGSAGARCVACHMPEQNYMVIDGRRDHSLRLPRPDLAQEVGAPDACTLCHADRTSQWAAEALDRWHGKAWRERPHYAAVIHAGLTQGVKGVPGLLALAADGTQPAIVRATAASLAEAGALPQSEVAGRLLRDPEPGVRLAALRLLENLDAQSRARLASPLLTDPALAVRIEAGRLLADVPAGELDGERLPARDRALAEYEAALRLDADWPTAAVNLGNLRLRQGRLKEAEAAFERALALDPFLAAAYVNLADLYRQRGREAEGEAVLRAGLARLPKAAALHHALGLFLVRRGESSGALETLEKAASLDPADARYAYVYAIALHSAGRGEEALAVLRAADERHPFDLDILSALVSISRERGEKETALEYARRLAEALPGDANVERLVRDLEQAQ